MTNIVSECVYLTGIHCIDCVSLLGRTVISLKSQVSSEVSGSGLQRALPAVMHPRGPHHPVSPPP